MGADRMGVGHNLNQKSHPVKIFDHLLSCGVAVHAGVLAAELVDRAVVV